MKKIFGIVLMALAGVSFITNAVMVGNARSVGEGVGMFLPGMLFLIIGLSLLQSKPATAKAAPAKTKSKRPRATRNP